MLVAMFSFAAMAQDFPYAKILSYDKRDFKEAKFKYDAEHNSWFLNHTRGLQATVNVLSALAGSDADIRPDMNDYRIVVAMDEKDQIASINVRFYKDETYHKLMTFARDNGSNLLDTSSGKLSKCQFNYDIYSMVLQMKAVQVTETTARTSAVAAVKTIDESYNVYDFIIYTGIEPWSPYLERQAAKQAKRDAKGKKKRNVEDLM